MRPQYITLDELRPTVDLAGYYSFPTNSLKKQSFEYRIPSHHLILIESGRIAAITPREKFSAKAGDLICFRPTDHNQYTVNEPTRFYQIHLEFAPPPRHKFIPWLDEIGPLPINLSLGDSFKAMRKVFETFCLEVDQEGVIHRLRVRAAIFEMLALIAAAGSSHSHDLPKLDEWQRARFRLGTDFSSKVSIERMGREMGITADYFIRQFNQRFGTTPLSYHTHARVREAARLLRSESTSIKEVAYRLNFTNPKSFARTFKRHLGVLPSDVCASSMPISQEEAPTNSNILSINQNVLPPNHGANWYQAYYPVKLPRSK